MITVERHIKEGKFKILNIKNPKIHWWDNLEELIFPPVCGICGKLNENYLCNKCNFELQKEAFFQIDNYITETGFKRKNFEEHIYFFQYQGLIREQIINYKFNEESYKYKFISNFILNNFILKDSKVFQIINDYDIIIPVPVSKKRFKQRGYNQAVLIAKQIAENVVSSTELSYSPNNTHKAFAIVFNIIRGMII